MAKKQDNTKALTWLNGQLREALGPKPNTLAPLNIIAFFVPHAHSDAAMQILHWYTTLGFCFVLFGSYLFLRKKFSVYVMISSLIIILFTLPVNTWIAINGMGIPYGRLFHLFMAAQFIFSYFDCNIKVLARTLVESINGIGP